MHTNSYPADLWYKGMLLYVVMALFMQSYPVVVIDGLLEGQMFIIDFTTWLILRTGYTYTLH